MAKHKIIVNPIAGRGRGAASIPLLTRLFQQQSLDYDLVTTQKPWHAVELTKQAVAEGYEVVVAVGGDGTANEVLNGLVLAQQDNAGKAALGVLCVGRGNDFAFGLGLPMEVETGVRILQAGQHKQMDVGLVRGGLYPEGRHFGNGVGIGFDAVVGFEALKLKRLHGFPSYIVAALKTIFLYFHAPLVRIELDEQTLTQSSLMVSIMNGRRMGGGFMMAPQAQMTDGIFDLCIAKQVSRLGILGLIPRFMQGTQAKHPAIYTTQSRKVIVTALQGVLPAHADGETLCIEGQQLEIELLPQAVEFIGN